MLEFKKTKTAINFLLSNANKKEDRKITIKFHGIGEPTLNWTNLMNIYNYSRKMADAQKIDVKFKITTNGVMPNKYRQWLAQNMSFITLSFDGFEELQNKQRPHKRLNSYHEVLKTINVFKYYNASFAIRTTVTNDNVDCLPEWTAFLSSLGVSLANYEPLWVMSDKIGICSASSERFLNNYREAKKIGASKNIAISYSRTRLEKKREHYCGACGTNFVLTPKGPISTCYIVFDTDNPLAKIFLIGTCDEDKIVIDYDKLDILKRSIFRGREECNNCFALYSCGGGCPDRRLYYQNKPTLKSIKIQCEITRAIILDEINDLINKINLPIDYNKTYKY